MSKENPYYYHTPFPRDPESFPARPGASAFLILVLTIVLLTLAGCGPKRAGASTEDLVADTRQIALDYRSQGSLDSAQAELAQLNVANANQWLIYVAETSISNGDDPGAIEALVRLIYDLGLQSTVVSRYAAEHDLPYRDIQKVSSGSGAVAEGAPAQTSPGSGEAPTPIPSPTSPPTAEPTPTAPPTAMPTSMPEPEVQAETPMNVRAGPGTEHPVVASLEAGGTAPIVGKNPPGDWWQIELGNGTTGWIYGPLVETNGNVGAVAVAAAIPTAPPATATPIPQPTQPAAPTATPVPAGPDFRLVGQRLWGVEENGGFLSGNSVNCGEKQVLRVVVLDANGNRLNGVTVKGVYRNELHVTGEKGDGTAEFDMNVDGDDIVVARDVDGREVTSDRAKNNTAKTYNIPFDQLIQGRYCTDDASCQAFVDTHGCFGHFSWTVTFQRNY